MIFTTLACWLCSLQIHISTRAHTYEYNRMNVYDGNHVDLSRTPRVIQCCVWKRNHAQPPTFSSASRCALACAKKMIRFSHKKVDRRLEINHSCLGSRSLPYPCSMLAAVFMSNIVLLSTYKFWKHSLHCDSHQPLLPDTKHSERKRSNPWFIALSAFSVSRYSSTER